MSIRTKLAILAPLAALSLTGLAAGSASADAHDAHRVAPASEVGVASYDGVCEADEVCLYFNSDFKGSSVDFYDWVEDFAGYKFLSAGNGKGQSVKNNAASACNFDDVNTARIHFNSGWGGAVDDIPPLTCRNLTNTYNENASLSWH
jgi:Peptidase inhibitor family I36